MASICYHQLSVLIRCSTSNGEKHKHKHHSVKLNRANNAERLTQNHKDMISTPTQLVSREIIIQDDGEDIGYRQTFVIRSNEVGPDKTATIESILYLLQETTLNHMWVSGIQGEDNGFGTTRWMMRNDLIWVLSRMQLQVDRYPIWRDVMEIDTWIAASGKNGIRRDWILRSQATGLVFARATSTWAIINKQTRRLSKMPDEVRAEMSPLSIEKQAIEEARPERIEKLDNALHVNSDLKPKQSDLDMNQHVNNVKYVTWMLETVPDEFLERHRLSGIILEYRRECGISDVVQSLCEPVNENLWALNQAPKSYVHLLQKKGHDPKTEEIVRGKTTWKRIN